MQCEMDRLGGFPVAARTRKVEEPGQPPDGYAHACPDSIAIEDGSLKPRYPGGCGEATRRPKRPLRALRRAWWGLGGGRDAFVVVIPPQSFRFHGGYLPCR
jgi:hypothetical protein